MLEGGEHVGEGGQALAAVPGVLRRPPGLHPDLLRCAVGRAWRRGPPLPPAGRPPPRTRGEGFVVVGRVGRTAPKSFIRCHFQQRRRSSKPSPLVRGGGRPAGGSGGHAATHDQPHGAILPRTAGASGCVGSGAPRASRRTPGGRRCRRSCRPTTRRGASGRAWSADAWGCSALAPCPPTAHPASDSPSTSAVAIWSVFGTVSTAREGILIPWAAAFRASINVRRTRSSSGVTSPREARA